MADADSKPTQGKSSVLPLVAHRGNAAEFPENTLPAIQSAIALGLSYVEVDVQLSADGVPMVLHDADLLRTSGAPGSVFDLSAQQLIARSVHEPARFGAKFLGTCIPLLDDLATVLANAHHVTAFIEIKRASIERHGLHNTMDTVLAALSRIRDQCVIISFSADAVAQAQSKGWRTGMVLHAYDATNRQALTVMQPAFAFCNHEKLPADDSPLWAGPWQWVLYEIETPEQAGQLRARGAHLLETMQVASMRAALAQSCNPPMS